MLQSQVARGSSHPWAGRSQLCSRVLKCRQLLGEELDSLLSGSEAIIPIFRQQPLNETLQPDWNLGVLLPDRTRFGVHNALHRPEH